MFKKDKIDAMTRCLFDKMTQTCLRQIPDLNVVANCEKRPLKSVQVVDNPNALVSLQLANSEWGLALASDEMHYLIESFLSPRCVVT